MTTVEFSNEYRDKTMFRCSNLTLNEVDGTWSCEESTGSPGVASQTAKSKGSFTKSNDEDGVYHLKVELFEYEAQPDFPHAGPNVGHTFRFDLNAGAKSPILEIPMRRR